MITAASVMAVALTGATAVGANIGILSSAQESPIGDLNAATDLIASTPQVIDGVIPETTVPTTEVAIEPSSTLSGSTGTVQEFDVDGAGFVTVAAANGTIRLGDVSPAAGWAWVATQDNDRRLRVEFESADSTLEFVARVDTSGGILARVDRPVIEAVQGSPATAPAPASTTISGDDDDDDDDHEEYEENDDEEHEEHEGRDDDD